MMSQSDVDVAAHPGPELGVGDKGAVEAVAPVDQVVEQPGALDRELLEVRDPALLDHPLADLQVGGVGPKPVTASDCMDCMDAPVTSAPDPAG